MDDLPEDVMHDILTRVGDAKHLANCDLVSKKFHRYRWPVVRAKRLRTDDGAAEACAEGALRSRHMVNLQQLVLEFPFQTGLKLEQEVWSRLESCRSTLQVLHMIGMHIENLWSIINGFPSLSSIRLEHTSFGDGPSADSSFPSLKSATLHLTYMTAVRDSHIYNLLRAAPLLETLDVWGSEPKFYVEIHSASLKRLSFHVPDTQLSIASCDRLESLDMFCTKGLDFRCLCPTLEEMDLRISVSDVSVLEKALLQCRRLVKLTVTPAAECSSSVSIRSSSLRHLTFINEYSTALVLECNALETLCILNSTDISIEADAAIHTLELQKEDRWPAWWVGHLEKLFSQPCLKKSSIVHLIVLPKDLRTLTKEPALLAWLTNLRKLTVLDKFTMRRDELRELVKNSFLLCPKLETVL